MIASVTLDMKFSVSDPTRPSPTATTPAETLTETAAARESICAAERGVRTLIVSSEVAHSLGDVLDTELTSVPVALAPKLDAMEIDARSEINRHYGAIREYLVELFRYQGIDEVVADELGVTPVDVDMFHSYTMLFPAGGGTGASQGVVVGGSTVHTVLQDARLKLAQLAAHFLRRPQDEVALQDLLLVWPSATRCDCQPCECSVSVHGPRLG